MKLPKLNAHSRAFQYFILPKSFLGQYTRAYTQFIRHTGRRMYPSIVKSVYTFRLKTDSMRFSLMAHILRIGCGVKKCLY